MKKSLKPILTVFRIILPAVILALAARVLSQWAAIFVLDGLEQAIIGWCVAILCTVIMYYFSVKYAVLFDSDMREKFIDNRDGITKVKDKLKLFFDCKYIAFLMVILYAALIPALFWHLFGMQLLGNTLALILAPAIIALFILIGMKAIFAAVKFWEEKAFYNRYYEFNYTLKNGIAKHILIFFSYTVGGVLLMLFLNRAAFEFVNLIVNNFSALFGLFTLFFHLFFIFPKVTKRIMSVVKRRRFLQELDEVCKKNNCSLSTVKNPYKSLLKNAAGEYNFEIEQDGRIYACKLLSAKHRLRPMTFFKDGTAAVSKIVRIKQTELCRKNKYTKYGFEAEGKKKIIIINPIPKSLFVCDVTGDSPLDNGDKVWEYSVYSITAFINAIDRNCLGK